MVFLPLVDLAICASNTQCINWSRADLVIRNAKTRPGIEKNADNQETCTLKEID